MVRLTVEIAARISSTNPDGQHIRFWVKINRLQIFGVTIWKWEVRL